MTELAPIVLFAFNRPQRLRLSLESLLRNSEAADSELFAFVDGARCEADQQAITEVQDILRSTSGFMRITIYVAPQNMGLAHSVISGVKQIIERYGRAIILEDDLIYSANFLSFMNQGLDRYERERRVFSICGYSNSVDVPDDYHYDAYLCARSSSWGWATWADRWGSVDWELTNWDDVIRHKRAFNRLGGSDLFDMLKAWRDGRNSSWAVRFCYSQFLQNGVSLFPITSKVQNCGFDGSGTHCKRHNRFRSDFDSSDNKHFKLPEQIEPNPQICRSAMSYHTIFARLKGKIRSIMK